jgi:hypothetical protein
VDDGGIAGEVAGIATAETRVEEGVAAAVGFGKYGGDVVRNFVRLE